GRAPKWTRSESRPCRSSIPLFYSRNRQDLGSGHRGEPPMWYLSVMGTMVNKLMQASMALLQATPDQQMNIVVLNKALFYLDLAALRDVAHVRPDQKYLALPMGPVLDKYERRIIRDLERAGLARQVEEGMAKPVPV